MSAEDTVVPYDCLCASEHTPRADAGDASIVGAVVNMGKSLRMRVVAEGVETHEQCAFLKEQHCPEAQGFYFHEPMISEEIAELFAPKMGRLSSSCQ